MKQSLYIILLAVAWAAIAPGASIPTTGRFDLRGVTLVDRTIDVAGSLQVTGRAEIPTIRNRQLATLAPSFAVRDGDALFLRNVILTQNGWPVTTRGIHALGGYLELSRVGIRDGDGMLIERCSGFLWRGGGTIDSTYAYTLYLGNNSADEQERRRGKAWYAWSRTDREDFVARGVVVQDVAFQCGRRETGVRVMGARGVAFRRCSFDVRPDLARKAADRHNKQAIQFRHGTGVLQDCSIEGSLVVGGLDPSIDAGIHADYAGRNPTYLWIRGGTIDGYVEVSSNTWLLLDGVRVTGRDPRGIGPTAGVDRKSYGPGLAPTVVIVNSEIGHWTLAGVNVLVGPGVTRNGVRVPQSAGYDGAIVDRIRREAVRDVPTWARPVSGPLPSRMHLFRPDLMTVPYPRRVAA